jgi:hypothetical protein
MSETLFIIICLALTLSLGLNVFAIWYSKSLLSRLYYISEHMITLVEEILAYNNHLNAVHEMEAFYGDETIGGLLRHTNGIIETLEDFAEIYTMFDDTAEELFEEVEDDDTETGTP